MVYTRKDLEKDFYTTGDIAKLIGRTARTVQKWCDKGMLDFTRTPSGHRMFSKDDLIEFLTSLGMFYEYLIPEELKVELAKEDFVRIAYALKYAATKKEAYFIIVQRPAPKKWNNGGEQYDFEIYLAIGIALGMEINPNFKRQQLTPFLTKNPNSKSGGFNRTPKLWIAEYIVRTKTMPWELACACCGFAAIVELKDGRRFFNILEVDHIEDLEVRGWNEYENQELLCKACHNRKSAKKKNSTTDQMILLADLNGPIANIGCCERRALEQELANSGSW